MEIRVEQIGPEDWEEFRDVRLRSLADAPEAFGSQYDDWVQAPEERWRSRLTVVPFTVVARREDRSVGLASGVPDGDGVELISMWVDPSERGSGTAGALIDAVVAWAGARPTYLMVRSENLRAIRAYERAGFVDTGLRADQDPDEPQENRMELRSCRATLP